MSLPSKFVDGSLDGSMTEKFRPMLQFSATTTHPRHCEERNGVAIKSIQLESSHLQIINWQIIILLFVVDNRDDL